MSDTSLHIPVMLDEVICALAPADTDLFIDATFGNGGYSRAILSSASCSVAAIDRDPDAILRGQELNDAAHGRLSLFEGPFSQMAEMMENTPFAKADGIVFDLGVCSTQLDQPERGFSFRQDGPLDMRMDPTSGLSACHWLAKANADEIAHVLWAFGEERFSRRIARAIVEARGEAPLETTAQLARLVSAAQPKKDYHKHPATRTFQAIRLFINGELSEVAKGIQAAVERTEAGGRLVVISFHSLEDRLVKHAFRDASRPPKGDPRMPLPESVEKPRLSIISKAVKPSAFELNKNPRARSAVLRVAERTLAA